MNKIERHIDELFSKLPNTKEAQEMKSELLANSKDKYNDLVNSGVDPEEAQNSVIDGIGNLDEWKQAFPHSNTLNDDYSDVQEIIKKEKRRRRNGTAIAVAVILVVLIGLFASFAIFNITQNKPSVATGDSNGTIEVTKLSDRYSEIGIDTSKYDIVIEYTDSVDVVEASLESSVEDELRIRDRAGVLSIESKYENRNQFLLIDNYYGTITLKLPKDATSKLNIENVSGTILINGTKDSKLDVLDIESVSSKITLNELHMNTLDIEVVSSDITMSDCWTTESVKIEGVSSDIAMYVDKKHPEFNLKVDGVVTGVDNNRTSHGDGLVEFKFESVSGHLSLYDLKEK